VSPDGSEIAYTSGFSPNGAREIWLMDAGGADARKLASADPGFWYARVVWAPDSQRVAYAKLHQAPERFELSIESRRIKGGAPATILSNSDLQDYCWLVDGRLIYSLAEPPPNPDNSNNLWALQVDTKTGEPSGRPQRLTEWAGFSMQGLSAAANGKRLVFQEMTFTANAYVAEFEANGTRIKPPQPITSSEGRVYLPLAWTGDSKAIILGTNRSGTIEIVKHILATKEDQTIATVPELNIVRVSADGAWILYGTVAEGGRFGPSTPVELMRVSVSGGAPQPIVTAPGAFTLACAWSPSDLCVVGQWVQEGQRPFLKVTALDPLKGLGPELLKVEAEATPEGFSISPDGSHIAVEKFGDDHIRIYPLNGEPAWDLKAAGWANLSYLDWSADGKGLFVEGRTPRQSTLLCIDLKGHARPLWQQRGTVDTWGIQSRDGRYLAMLGGTMDSNVWMIENF
jgi:dipeptidyl aminopeptidase/acylaminoacyl peptidase